MYDHLGNPYYVGNPYGFTILAIHGTNVLLETESSDGSIFESDVLLKRIKEDFYNNSRSIEETCPEVNGAIVSHNFLGSMIDICEYTTVIGDYLVRYRVSDEVPGAVIQRTFFDSQTNIIAYDHVMVSSIR